MLLIESDWGRHQLAAISCVLLIESDWGRNWPPSAAPEDPCDVDPVAPASLRPRCSCARSGLHQLLDYLIGLGPNRVWLAKRADIAAHWRAHHPPPVLVPKAAAPAAEATEAAAAAAAVTEAGAKVAVARRQIQTYAAQT